MDLGDRRPQRLTRALAEEADVVVTMGCDDACPFYSGKRYEDWEIEDPAGKTIEEVRSIRDEVEARVRQLLNRLDAA